MKYSHLRLAVLITIFMLLSGGFYTYYKSTYNAVQKYLIHDIKWEMYGLNYNLLDYLYNDRLSSFLPYMDNVLNINKLLSSIEITDENRKIVLSTRRGRVGEVYKKELIDAGEMSKNNINKNIGYFMPIVYDSADGREIYYLIFETKKDFLSEVLLNKLEMMAVTFLLLTLSGLALVYYITHRYISIPILALTEFVRKSGKKPEKFYLKELDELKESLLSYIDEVDFQKKYNRTILDSQQDIVVVTSGDRIKDVNQAFFEFFSEYKTLDEFKQKHNCICELFEPESRDNFLHYNKENPKTWIKTLLKNPHIKYKAKITRDNKAHIFALSAKKMKKNSLYVAVLGDITLMEEYQNNLSKLVDEEIKNKERTIAEKKKLEAEMESKERLLVQQTKLSTLGEMLGSIAHQWKQPLSGISLTVGLIEEIIDESDVDSEVKKEIRENLEQITKHVAFMSQTINDFRNFFKPSKERAHFSILTVISEIYNLLSPQYKNHGMRVEVRKNGDFDDTIDGFPSEFKQVIMNLLNNTKDALDERKKSDRYKDIITGDIEIEISQKDSGILIVYSDNAGGIDEHTLNKMFTPYNTTKGEEGTGIGMYISSQIVTNMGGNISAKNSKRGSIFTIYLPKS